MEINSLVPQAVLSPEGEYPLIMEQGIGEASIVEIQTLMQGRKLTSVELVKYYIDRIAKIDKDGPVLNSVLELNPDLFFIAESLDDERTRTGGRGLMHGIPVLIKDNINTGDKMHTSGGSIALADSYAPKDAFVVQRLREAGAIIMGKTNMTEFANFMDKDMPSGYSSRGGQVLNPYDKTKTPSGSSSGSAVAVTANLCTVAIGTETNGSIINPARVNCIVGIKPTVGLVSRNGIIPISHSQDTAGPLARSVLDAAITLSAMMGVDSCDPATWVSDRVHPENILKATEKTDISGLRIGINIENYEMLTPMEQQILDNAIDIFQKKGAVAVKLDKRIKAHSDEGSSVCLYEFKAGINYYLSKLGHQKIKTLTDIIQFNKLYPEKALKYGQSILELSDMTSGTLTESRYLLDRINDIEYSRTYGLDKVMAEYNLDVFMFLEQTNLASVSGYPSIIIPAGINDGEAYGVQFISKPFHEALLIKLGYIYEQATKSRIVPPL